MPFDFTFKKNDDLPDVIEVLVNSFEDKRGSVWTSFSKELFSEQLKIESEFIHDKFSFTRKGALRGIHGDKKSWKLVSCVFGSGFQVVVDARPYSASYLKVAKTVLSADNKKMLLIPPMFGNGFCAAESDVLYHYKMAYEGAYNDAENQFTIKWSDPRLDICWPVKDPLLSDRDAE